MPTYRYECAGCGRIHEIFHSMTETRRKCPDCGGKLTRLIGAGGGVILKGGGFHNTDYRSDSYRKAEKKDREAAKTGDGGTKSDTGAKGEAKKGGGTAKKPAAKGKKKAKE